MEKNVRFAAESKFGRTGLKVRRNAKWIFRGMYAICVEKSEIGTLLGIRIDCVLVLEFRFKNNF